MNLNHDCKYMEIDYIYKTSLCRCYCSMRPDWLSYHISGEEKECEFYEPKRKKEKTC